MGRRVLGHRLAGAILDALDVPIVAVDADARIIFANESFSAPYGRTADLIGSPLFIAGGHWDAPRLRFAVRQSLDASIDIAPFELRTRTPEGGVHTFLIAVRAFRAPDGSPLCLVVAEDVSLRVSRERASSKELEAAQSERGRAQSANLARDVALAMVSHELAAPLMVVRIQAELLSGGHVTSVERRAAAAAITEATREQSLLIEDLLDVSRLNARTLRMDDVVVDLGKVVEQTIHATARIARLKSIQVHARVLPSVWVAGDEARLKQVAWNLLSNALRFTQRMGRIVVTVKTRGDMAVMKVSDNGVGIARDGLALLFRPFTQLEDVTRTPKRGLGLGLSIVRLIVERHRGNVTAKSGGLGKGSTFTVALPLRAPA